MPQYYAGIGSRSTPIEPYQAQFKDIASVLEKRGFILRSGGAEGADEYFESGVSNADNKQIYLPWKKYRDNPSPLYTITDSAYEVAQRFHRNWNCLTQGGKALHARNTNIVLGPDVTRLDNMVSFIICWTPNGQESGGTGQALRMAEHFNIPVFNFGSGVLYKDDLLEHLLLFRDTK